MPGSLRARTRGRTAITQILGGSVFGQGIVLAISPLLTRVYSPTDFSSLALVTAFVAVLSSIATLSWERAVILPTTDEDGWIIVRMGVWSTVAISIVIGAIGFLLRDHLSEVFNSDLFELYWWVIPVTTMLVGLFAVLSSWAVRHQSYVKLGIRNALLGVGQAVSSVGLGAAGFVPVGLLISPAVGRAISLSGLVRGRGRFGESVSRLSEMKRLAMIYRKFPLITSWSRALNSLGLQLPMVLIIGLFGSYQAGFVALTIRVLAAPVGIVVDAVSQFFEGVASSKVRDNSRNLTALTLTVTKWLLLVGLIPAVTISLFGQEIFSALFGEEWSIAGELSRVLAWVYLLQFVVVPVSRTLLILQYQATQMVWDISRVVASGIVILSLYRLGLDLETVVAAFAATQAVWYLILLTLVLFVGKRYDGQSRMNIAADS